MGCIFGLISLLRIGLRGRGWDEGEGGGEVCLLLKKESQLDDAVECCNILMSKREPRHHCKWSCRIILCDVWLSDLML